MKTVWIAAVVLAAHVAAGPAAIGQSPELPAAQCLRPSEHGSPYGPFPDLDEFPDYDEELAILTAECTDFSFYKVEGMCADGRKVLVDSTGFTMSIKLYTAEDKFQSLIWQSDAASAPCWGQGVWPSYEYCEAPRITRKICGMLAPVGTPAFIDRWAE